MHKPDIKGRLAAWTIELSQFYIEYKPRTAIKAQFLSDFVAECQFKSKTHKPEDDQSRLWLLFVDGSSTSNSGGAGVILISPGGFKIQQALKFGFSATNNVAEYEALIAGLKLASDLEAKVIDIFGDSQLVSKQISGEFKTHNERMARYLTRTQELLSKFPSWKMSNVDREENQWANSLAKLASSNLPTNLSPTYVDILETPSIDEVSINQIQARLDWRQPFLETTPRSATVETPFRLAYGVDAVIPVEISLTSPRVDVFDPAISLEGLRLHNDLLEETREEARMRMIAQQEKIARYFNKKVKPKDFKVNDLVLRDSATSQPTVSGKFKPAWEGPYRISRLVSAGSYELAHLDGKPIKNAWNGIHLKNFYQ
ncbi:uncharacterized protein LOC141714315 [Apium graveolens]|uniref:uncharacterized protein LOC141714315 n=1 Tax=Apium graveolens TaxID=4045 RepID=UPI003D7A21C7